MSGTQKPRLLLVSPVLPLPPSKGQSQRVYNKLVALRDQFHITFLTVVLPDAVADTQAMLMTVVDAAVVLPRLTHRHAAARAYHTVRGGMYTARRSLRPSNYVMGQVELSPQRVAQAINPADFDIVLYEYWHTHQTAALFRQHGALTVLDMHDLLWRTFELRLSSSAGLGARFGRNRRVAAYRRQEEAAWDAYDIVIAINEAEAETVRALYPQKPVIYTPMGIDLARWPVRWQPAHNPARIGFYGALGNAANQRAVHWCYARILPHVWRDAPDVEFWIIGSNPPPEIEALAVQDTRVHVTGFVDDPVDVIGRNTLVLCPWTGRFGFRSRIIELLAVGTPVVATRDAVYGMGLEAGAGVLLADDDASLAQHCLTLLQDRSAAVHHSRAGRLQVEEQFSFAATYGKLADDLRAAVEARRASAATLTGNA